MRFVSLDIAGIFVATVAAQSYEYTLQQVGWQPGLWRTEFNRPDKAQQTTVITTTSASTTITTTETPSATYDAPWDVVTATADAEDGSYQAGDYIFNLSPDGQEDVDQLFSEIEAACGLPAKRRRALSARRALALQRRTNTEIAECARDYIASSAYADVDTGLALNIGTISVFDAEVAVTTSTGAALTAVGAVLLTWWLGSGGTVDDASPVLPAASVSVSNEDLVDTGTGDVDDPEAPPELDPLAPHSTIGPTADEVAALVDERIGWQQTAPYAVRQVLREFPGTEPTCQHSELDVPLASSDGDPDAASSIGSFCREQAGTELTEDEPSVYQRFEYDDHAFWLVASIWEDSDRQYCNRIVVDADECSAAFAYGYTVCDDEASMVHGSEWQGECTTYTLTVDADPTRDAPPSWDEAGTPTEEPEPEPSPTEPPQQDLCYDDSEHVAFSTDQASQAIDDYCDADRNVDQPLIGGTQVDDRDFTLIMMRSRETGCNSWEDGYEVVASDCREQFSAAVDHCSNDGSTYGNDLIWNSPGGCITFRIFADEVE